MKVVLAVSAFASVEVEGDSACDVFEGLSQGQEVFGHGKCGICGNENVSFRVRANKDDDKFYEMVCNDFKCRGKLAFGCLKKPKGALYPKTRWDALSPSEKENRKDQESQCRAGYLPNGGWFIFKSSQTEESKSEKTEPQNKTEKAPF